MDTPGQEQSRKRKSMMNGAEKTGSRTRVRMDEESESDPVEHSIPLDAHGSLEYGANWARPALPTIDSKSTAIVFQQIDIDEQSQNNIPRLRIFGVSQAGHSVLVHIQDFLPYFWVPAPRSFQNSDCRDLLTALNAALSLGIKPVHSVKVANKTSLWGYTGDSQSPFLKIVLTDFKHLGRVKNAFERGEINFRDMFSACTTFESNIAYTLRFMIDKKVTGMNWLEIPAGSYKLRAGSEKASNCQIELDTSSETLISHAPEGEWSKMAPFRVLSYDIECSGRKGVFPDARLDPVIQIANMVTAHGSSVPFVRNVFTLNSCSHIAGSQVLEFQSEEKLLAKWQAFVAECDPDLVIGYNTSNFDMPYLLDRAKALKVTSFPYLGRMKNSQTAVKETHFSSKAYGTRDSKETHLDGRLQLDLLQVMQRDYKLRSYTLNAVCAHFLGEQKEDVHHSIITDLQNGSARPDGDAYLPQRLMDKLMCFVNYTEMARVTGVPFNYLLSRGQQIKVVSQLYRRAGPSIRTWCLALKHEGSDEPYDGATVMEPVRGFYDVADRDAGFRLATAKQLGLRQDEDFIITPNGDYFVKTSKRKGLLAIVLEDLLSARKRARAELKLETDPFKRAVLDGRQLALKISANSVYGFTGATVGKLPCLPISMSVTAFGREMIKITKDEVELKYTKANGYDDDAQVIYGDTDSVMVKFGCSDLATSMKLGAEAADFVSGRFQKPIKLEFEKVYFPYLLISKKRYAGLHWTKLEKHDKMDAKGIETVRRDNCPLVQTVIETCLKKMLIERDVKGAEAYTKQVISDLLQNRIDLSQLVITKALAKADYAAKQAHVELAKRMKKRDAGSAPALGDRVAYVIIKGAKDARAYEKSEDPLYVLENNIPIDTKYYLDNQLSKPLMRIFEPILGEKSSSLLSGDHTRVVSIATPTQGGLMGFIKRTETCLGCRVPLGKSGKDTNTAVCKNCRPKTAALYSKQMALTQGFENAFARLWTQCQRCQGSLHQEVICTASDCPIFYMRTKSRKDVEDSYAVLQRFDGAW
ncbi:hypothetical protein PCASD_21942 [Puccinia coronata f. sp. avenae]|uniref:DNA polymerase n=1 Tax=Puccinia coronata f. sp. avenae TaxID=200324 RepID=A0A2N5T4I0_9BASI|nr:hypothetical protein PCASD_21942 [Puccinia coronata f. sp. avenae]